MTREESATYFKRHIELYCVTGICREAEEMAIKALQNEPLTDIEQRIFLAAMSKEEKVCNEVCADGEGVDLVAVCHRIERKVKKALWS